MTGLWLMQFCLGIEVWQEPRNIFISQSKYAGEILKVFGMIECKLVGTPIEVDMKLSMEDTSPLVEERLYQKLGRSFKESLKSLGADIQHANTLASEFPCEYDGACLQMRLSYSPTARYFLFLLQWTGCSLAGALGLLRILIYKAYLDGTTTMYRRERKATLQEFYAFIYPSLQQFQRLTTTEVIKQRTLCSERYKRKADDTRVQLPDSDLERDQECGICMENNSKIVLPDCNHAMCMKCYRDWRVKSQSCPFCRETLKRVKSSDLWVFVESGEVQDMGSLERDNARRLFMFIDKLPLLVVDKAFAVQDSHIK